ERGEPRGEPVRHYTWEHASQLLPELTQVLEQLRQELARAADPVTTAQIRRSVHHNGGGDKATALLRAGERVRRQLQFLQEHGILLRDVQSGLVDFPSVRDGREVYLCWRLGEPEIGFWHGVDEGFANRRPL
ncbi:MAG: DUF2203 domain-containing protein, partial [Candidatus Dormibacteria bacterium]